MLPNTVGAVAMHRPAPGDFRLPKVHYRSRGNCSIRAADRRRRRGEDHLQFLDEFQRLIDYQEHRGGACRKYLYQQLLHCIANHRIADRADRLEPLLLIRRPKTSPGAQERHQRQNDERALVNRRAIRFIVYAEKFHFSADLAVSTRAFGVSVLSKLCRVAIVTGRPDLRTFARSRIGVGWSSFGGY